MTAANTNEYRRLPMAAEELLPHRPPMLFVESLVARAGNTARATATMPGDGIGFCVDGGQVLPEYFIELIAQAMAMANGYDAICKGRPPNDGMLVAVDTMLFINQPLPGAELTIDIEKTSDFGPIKIISGTVLSGGVRLVEGVIKVWENVGQTS